MLNSTIHYKRAFSVEPCNDSLDLLIIAFLQYIRNDSCSNYFHVQCSARHCETVRKSCLSNGLWDFFLESTRGMVIYVAHSKSTNKGNLQYIDSTLNSLHSRAVS